MASFYIIPPRSKANRFSSYSRDQLLEQYKNENWNALDSQKRLELMQATVNVYSQEIGVKEAPSLKEETAPSRYGGYSVQANIMSVNLKHCNNPYEALDTIAHEVNHAYQAQCIRENNGYTQEERALLKSESGSAYREGGAAYDRQSLEVDSNNAGLRFLLAEQARYEKNPRYSEYLNGRVKHFSKVAEEYRQNTQVCRDSEKKQIEEARSKDEISPDEYQSAMNCLQDGHDYIKQECVSLEGCVQESLKESVALCSKDLHRRFEETQLKEDRGAMDALHEDITIHKNTLEECAKRVKDQINTKRQEITQYVYENNMERFDTKRDPFYKQMVSELSTLQQEKGRYDYSIAELQTDDKLMGYQECMDRGETEEFEIEDGLEGLERGLDEVRMNDGLDDIEHIYQEEGITNNIASDGLEENAGVKTEMDAEAASFGDEMGATGIDSSDGMDSGADME